MRLNGFFLLLSTFVFSTPSSLNDSDSCEHRLLCAGIDFLASHREPSSGAFFMNFMLDINGAKNFPAFRFERATRLESAAFRWMREDLSSVRLGKRDRVFSIERGFDVEELLPRLKDRKVFRFDPFAEAPQKEVLPNFLATGFRSGSFSEVFAIETIFSTLQVKIQDLPVYEFSFYELFRLLMRGGTLYIGAVKNPLLLQKLYSWSQLHGAVLYPSKRFQGCFAVRRP